MGHANVVAQQGKRFVQNFSLAGQGARVLALSRVPGPVLPGVTHIPYDQGSEASIRVAARLIPGPVDVVIHNAAIRGDTGGLATLTADHLVERIMKAVPAPEKPLESHVRFGPDA